MMKPLSSTRRYAPLALGFLLLEAVLIAFADQPLSQYMRAVEMEHPSLIDFFRAWTDLGKSCWYLWPSGIGAIACFSLSEWRQIPTARRDKLRRASLMFGFFFVCVALSGIVTDMIKPLIGRARPVLMDRDGMYGFRPINGHAIYNSFPSGHATTAFAVAFALIALYPRAWKWLIAFAIAISLSRVMVNAHYLADVFAGAVVGILTVAGVQDLFRRWGSSGKKYGIFPIDTRPARR